mgnify:CR=1 FL=1
MFIRNNPIHWHGGHLSGAGFLKIPKSWGKYIQEKGSGGIVFKTDGSDGEGAYQFFDANWRPILKLFSGSNARVSLYHGGSEKLGTTTDGIKIYGGLQDKDGDLGNSGQVLTSTGTELNWVPATSGQKGEKGEKGIKGEDNSTKGQKGDAIKGEKGQKGVDGEDGTSVKGNKGEKGQKGEGDKGQKGVDGNATKGQKGDDNSTKGDKGQKGQDGSAGSTGIPSGFIGIWSGLQSNIPSGWYLCDGNNGTPDLRNRFIVGAGNSYNVGVTGGFDSVSLSESQIPSHTHSSVSYTHLTLPTKRIV